VATNLTHTRAAEGQTGSCLVLVTPDAERSMCTFLGVSAELNDSALHPKDIAKSRLYYMEGYLAASPTGLAAALQGKAHALAAGVPLALTLSDVSMIRFCKAGLDAMLDGGVDFLFCNEEEAQVWTGLSAIDAVASAMAPLAKTVCITRGPQGCLILQGSARHTVATVPVKAVDTNGAGDMFAGAFLFGVSQGWPLTQAATLANRCAAAVVSQHGNRLTRAQMQSLLRQA
jgi:sugar/nucleoside kinase (ribokinase family)